MIDKRDLGMAQVRAHRHARRQTDEALTLGVTDLRHAPGRSARRLTGLSYLMAMAILAGAGVLSLVRPAPDWRAAQVLIESGSGAVFLHRDGVLHPALNLTSALLAASGPVGATPMEVSVDDIATASRGSTLGIAGAPSRTPTAARLAAPLWSLCDRTDGAGHIVATAVIGSEAAGLPLGAGDAVLLDRMALDPASADPASSDPASADTTSSDTAVVDAAVVGTAVGSVAPDLTSAGTASAAQLWWATGRLAVDRTDLALVRALGLSDLTPRPVSAPMAAVLPVAAAPTVSGPVGDGEAPTGFVLREVDGADVTVGSLLRVVRAAGEVTLYVVHRDGVEVVTPLVADLLRFRTGARLVTVDPQQVAAVPSAAAHTATPDAVPPAAPRVLDATVTPDLCATWRGAADGWQITVGTTAVTSPAAVSVPAAAGRVDRVQIAVGTGALVTTSPDGSSSVTSSAVSSPTVSSPTVSSSDGSSSDGSSSTGSAPTEPLPSDRVDDPGMTFVDALGIAYPITLEAAIKLGLTTDGATVPFVPAALIDALAPGPALDVDAAGRSWQFDATPDDPGSATPAAGS